MKNETQPLTSRRQFLKTSSSAAVVGAVAPLIVTSRTRAVSPGDTLKVGLVGCGGRGTGAAAQALNADNSVALTAMGDAFEDRLKGSLSSLERQSKDKVKVDPEHRFVGLDAFQKVIDSGVDVVILATPPGFRPQHLKAAVAAGKHVFCEKPMATDAPGVRSVMETVKESKRKKLALVAGFCWRYDYARREFYKRIQDGAIGDVRSVYATYYTGPVRPMAPPDQRPAGMGDLEWQMRNWYNFTWLGGDGLVEQAVHSVDKIAWLLDEKPPVRAVAVGGRQIPNYEGNIFDHIEVNYEYPDGLLAFMGQRQISGCYNQNADYVTGAKGQGTIGVRSQPMILGETKWRYEGPGNNMYQTEHDELFASIRDDNPLNDGDRMATSTMLAIMGRMAAYTGKAVTWDEALNSEVQLVPEPYSWDMKLPIAPMAMPGRTKLA